MGQLEYQRLVEVRKVSFEHRADYSDGKWRMVEAFRVNQHKKKVSKTLCSYSAICKKLQLLTKNGSYTDKESLGIRQATNKIFQESSGERGSQILEKS